MRWPTNRTRTLQVRLDDDELDRLNKIADATGVPAYARTLLLTTRAGVSGPVPLRPATSFRGEPEGRPLRLPS